MDKMINYILELDEFISELDEMNTTAAVGGYQTPHAFGTRPKSSYEKFGMKVTTNKKQNTLKEYFAIDETETDLSISKLVHKRVADAYTKVCELESLLEKCIKHKQKMSEGTDSVYYKRTKRKLGKINEKINKIQNNFKSLI